MFELHEHPVPCDRGGENIHTHTDALQDILYTAWKFDDKPHQLYLAIARAARMFSKDDDTRDEIVRLMDKKAGV
jgi:hypothetical protein